MGCDIHPYVERLNDAGKWEKVEDLAPFNWRSYGMFGFLADVRNYSVVPPIAEPRGLPEDVSPEVAGDHEYWDSDAHSTTWLSVQELVEFDYDQEFNDRRITRNGDGGVTGAPEEGAVMTFREFLGAAYMSELEELVALGDPARTRVVFWFDN